MLRGAVTGVSWDIWQQISSIFASRRLFGGLLIRLVITDSRNSMTKKTNFTLSSSATLPVLNYFWIIEIYLPLVIGLCNLHLPYSELECCLKVPFSIVAFINQIILWFRLYTWWYWSLWLSTGMMAIQFNSIFLLNIFST